MLSKTGSITEESIWKGGWKQSTLFYVFSILFVVAGCYFTLEYFLWVWALPVLLIIILLALFKLDILFYIIAGSTPLAISLLEIDVPSDTNVPTEPLMVGVMIVFIIKQWFSSGIDKRIWRHPVTIAIGLNLVWILLTSITSEMPAVSFKFLLARIWFIVTMFLLGVQVFKYPGNFKLFTWAYCVPLLLVIIYTMFRLNSFGFNKEYAHWMMTPFYKDHAIYGAVIAMFLPVLIGFSLHKGYSKTLRFFAITLLIAFIVGEVFSYTRAAWASLVAALGVFAVIQLRIKLKYLLVVGAIGAIAVVPYFDQIIIDMERNKTDSSDDLAEHVQSISNIATDASNLERLNRWNCALEMFKERPVLGWGPGTYMFLYAPFQHSEDLTIISTNFGDLGNAHSEYLGPLAESGVLGSVTFLLIVIAVSYTAIRLYYRLTNPELKMMVLTAFLGLVTYYIHGVLNNYLDSAKTSVLFWGFTALIVAVDIYAGNTEKGIDSEKPAAE